MERGEYMHTEGKSTEEQSAEEGPVKEELAGEEHVERKLVIEDSTKAKSINEDFAKEHSVSDESREEGYVEERSTREGSTREGSTREGSTREGSTGEGSEGEWPEGEWPEEEGSEGLEPEGLEPEGLETEGLEPEEEQAGEEQAREEEAGEEETTGYERTEYEEEIGFDLSLGERPKDLPTAWRGIEPYLYYFLKVGSSPPSEWYYAAYNAVFSFCTRPTRDDRSRIKSHLLGRELYENFDRYAQLHLQQVTQSILNQQDEDLVQCYDRQWRQFKTALAPIHGILRYLNQYWIPRELDEERKDVYYIRSLLILRWKERVSEPLKSQLVDSLLALIEVQRDHTKILQVSSRGSASRKNETSRHTDALNGAKRNSLIKSIIESFVVITGNESETDGNFYKEYFENEFLTATRKYYNEEARTLRDSPKLEISGYAHWVLNRLSVEKSFMPTASPKREEWHDYFDTIKPDELVLPLLLQEFHNSFYTPELGAYYQKFKVRKQTNQKSEDLLTTAGLKAHDDMVELLVGSRERLRDPDRHGQTVLHSAVLADNIPLIKALLKLDAPTDVQDKQGETAGHLAVMTKNLAALNCLFVQPACCTALNGQPGKGTTIGALIRSKQYNRSDKGWEEALKVSVRLEKAAWLFDKPWKFNESNNESNSGFQPTVVNFESGVLTSQQPVELNEILSSDAYYQKEMEINQEVKWLHFPTNNMRWVELLMLRYGSHQKALLLNEEIDEDKNGMKALDRDDILGEQLWRERLHTGVRGFAHARYMKPLCERIGASGDTSECVSESMSGGKSECSYVFMMPYIHWEFADTFDFMTTYAKQLSTRSTSGSDVNPETPYQKLMKLYMSPPKRTYDANVVDIHRHEGRYIRQLHIRRSLDQYHYHALKDTSSRDKDQLVSRMFDENREYHLEGRQVLMVVDQLWLWVLKENTVFTSFTGRWSKGDTTDDPDDTTDVFENITLDRSPTTTPHDLAGKIIQKCLTSCLDSGTNTAPKLQFLEFYSTEIGRLADQEANHLKEFRRVVMRIRSKVHGEPEPQSQSATHVNSEAGTHLTGDDDFDVAGDISLLEQIKDIQDELHIMKILIQDQTFVIDKFCELQEGVTYAEKAKRTVRDYRVEVESIITRANHTYQMVSDLLDLKQKYANVQEARSSRQQAEETAKQGKTIMVFTIVTIVFLPLSFMATFFAIQVKEFEGMSLGFVSKIMFPVSLAFVIPLVYLAFNIDGVSKPFSKKLKKREDGTTLVRRDSVARGSTRRRNVTSDEESQTGSHYHSS